MLLTEIRIIEFPIGEVVDASFLFNLLLTIGLTREPKHRVKVKEKKKKRKYKESTSMTYLTKIMIISWMVLVLVPK